MKAIALLLAVFLLFAHLRMDILVERLEQAEARIEIQRYRAEQIEAYVGLERDARGNIIR